MTALGALLEFVAPRSDIPTVLPGDAVDGPTDGPAGRAMNASVPILERPKQTCKRFCSAAPYPD